MDHWLSFFAGASVLDLAHQLSQEIPTSPSHVRFQMALKRRHGDSFREDGGSGASEMMVTSPHTGTHIDALCHASADGRLYGGVDAYESQRGGTGFAHYGAETIPPLLCRGALLDVPRYLSKAMLEPAHEVTPEELQRVAADSGVSLDRAEVILVRTGWAAHWHDPDTYLGADSGVPGVGARAARWLADHSPKAVGSDTMAFEHIAPGAGHRNLPAHTLLLVEEGVHIIENLNLEPLFAADAAEFLFVLTPLPIVGATGSPARPLAVVHAG